MTEAKTDIEIENLSETMRIQRKGSELGVEGQNFAVHQLNQQADVLKTAAENIGAMGNVDFGGGGGLNPIGLMTGMAVGNAMGNQMSGMMNSVNNQVQSPPLPPMSTDFIALNGQQSGPFNLNKLKQMALSSQFTKLHHVWKEGMYSWKLAENIAELTGVFGTIPPPTI